MVKDIISRILAYYRDPLRKNAFYLMINAAIGGLLGFIFWMVVARFYSPAEVGLASAVISATSLIAMLSSLGFGTGIIRFLSSASEKANVLINSCLTISGLVAIILTSIFLLTLEFFSQSLLFLRSSSIYITGFIVFTASFVMVSILDNVFIANRRAEYVVLKTLIVGSRILFTIFFVAFGAFGIFASIGLADIIAFFTGTFILIPLVQRGYIPFPSIQKSVLNDILHFSIGNHIATVLNSAPGLLLPILITNVLIPETAAYFYIAWMIASLLYVIPLSIATSLFAESSYDERTLHLNVGKAIKFISLLTLPTIVMLMLIADKLLFLFGKGYSENATILLWIFALASIPLAINNLFITIRLIEKKVGIVILINAFIAAFTIVGSYLGLEKFGLLSIGIAWMLSQGIVMLAIARRLSFSAIKEVYSS